MTDKRIEEVRQWYRAEDGHYYCHRCPIFKSGGTYCAIYYHVHTEEDCEKSILAFEDMLADVGRSITQAEVPPGSFLDTVDHVRTKYTTAQKPVAAAENDGAKKSAATNDPVNHPAHYTAGGVECIDAIYAALGQYTDPIDAWLAGQVIKYLWRAPLKGKYVQDISKAMFYLKRLEDRNEKCE